MLRTLLILFAFVICASLASPSSASPVTYTIDPTQSSLLAGGLLSGNVPSSQTFGSNLTTYNGTISADRTATSIQFTLGSFIDADRQPSRQHPDIGGEDGTAVADYGLVAPNMFGETEAAFRDLIFDLYSDPLTVAANGNFDGGFDIVYSSGSVDWNSGFQWDSRDFTGSDLFNQSPNTPNISVANGIETLSLPVRFSKIFSTEHTSDSTFRLSGTLVATRSVGNSNPPQWKTDGGGSWNDTTNWEGGIPNSATASANFLGVLTAANSPAIVTLDGDKTVGAIYFDNANSYIIAPGSAGTLTIVGDVDVNGNNINVSTGNHTISAPLVIAASTGMLVKPGATLTISGPFSIAAGRNLNSGGVITISGPQNHGAISSYNTEGLGLTTFASNAGTPATAATPAIANLFISVGANASVTFTADQDLLALGLATGDGPEHIDLASPAGPGAFRAIHIYSSDLAAEKTILYSSIANANRAGAADPTIGIFDSGRAQHANSAIGIALVNDAHGDPSVFIRLTRIGDLNLDGIVTISDFIDLASNFNQSGPDITWQEGDLNYDHAVTISDFIDLASNFNSSYASNSIPISADDMALLEGFAAAHGVSLVPEPSALLILMSTMLLARARRLQRCPSTNPTFFPTAKS